MIDPLTTVDNMQQIKKHATTFAKQLLCIIFLTVTLTAQATEPTKKEGKTIKKIPYQITPTNSLWDDKNIDSSFYDNPYKVSLFYATHGEDSDRLLQHTYTVFGLGLGVLGVLYALPESVTKWNKEDANDISTKWKNNVSRGPIWDRDDPVLNFIGHPYFGGVFYQSARKSGYRQWDSFLYSALMSTFYWEYGIEAFAEVPSAQDLVITPVFGWTYGEWAFQTERDIWLHNAKVMNSETLGNISLFLLDPVDSIARNINYLFGSDIIKAGTGYITLNQNKLPNSSKSETEIGLSLSYTYGSDDSKASSSVSLDGPKYSSLQTETTDPVDTGIVGISLGAVGLNFDKDRNLKAAYGYQSALGLYFTKSFSSRLAYSHSLAKSSTSNSKITYENYGIDSQYYFNADSNLRPFITAGLGDILINENNHGMRFAINGGLGLHYKLNNNFAIQADWRHYYSTRDYENDDQYGARVIYRFGEGERDL